MENFPIGDPWTPGNMQGPQISETQRQKVLGLIRAGGSGARLITGGGIPESLPVGYYTQPTLLADVDPDATIAQEEIFGPVLTVSCTGPSMRPSRSPTTASTDSPVVSGADLDRALDVAKRIRTGNVSINSKSHFGIDSPFGGPSRAGWGIQRGPGYLEYLHIKTIGMPE